MNFMAFWVSFLKQHPGIDSSDISKIVFKPTTFPHPRCVPSEQLILETVVMEVPFGFRPPLCTPLWADCNSKIYLALVFQRSTTRIWKTYFCPSSCRRPEYLKIPTGESASRRSIASIHDMSGNGQERPPGTKTSNVTVWQEIVLFQTSLIKIEWQKKSAASPWVHSCF